MGGVKTYCEKRTFTGDWSRDILWKTYRYRYAESRLVENVPLPICGVKTCGKRTVADGWSRNLRDGRDTTHLLEATPTERVGVPRQTAVEIFVDACARVEVLTI
ncbi:hypothetical protein PoB_005296500 [Plakobranchus ocellatus]|uniref:Uncharacterized protein n=1 Tax=Plakobranchus ocellatus TaxID=259542 RepID=A0AAV4C4W8_9GAST|nr:hypothetical protein PoB_005296500 [Plakobranchus ocellatus]